MKVHASSFMTAGLALSRLALVAVCAGTVTAQPADTQPQPPSPTLSVQSYRQLAPGLLARTRFNVDEASGRRIQLLDLLVGPGMRSTRTSLGGHTVLEVRAGEAVLSIDDKQQRVSSGSTVHIPARAAIEIANMRGDLDVSIRATVITEGSR